MQQAQEQVLFYDGGKRDYTPALLGNDLRLSGASAEHRLVTELAQAIRPIREFLVAVVALSDDEIVSRARLPSETDATHAG